MQAHIAVQHSQLLAHFRVSDLIKLQYVHDYTSEVVPELAYEQGVRLPAKIRRVNPPSSTVSAPPAVQSGVYHNVSTLPPFKAEYTIMYRPLPPFKAEFIQIFRPLTPFKTEVIQMCRPLQP